MSIAAVNEPVHCATALQDFLFERNAEVAEDVAELAPPTPAELRSLRTWDPQGFFLR